MANVGKRFRASIVTIFFVAMLAVCAGLLTSCAAVGASSGSNSAQTPSSASASAGASASASDSASGEHASVEKNGTYTSKDQVALYIHTYGTLPSNFISKTKARNAGWDSSTGNLQDVCPGKSIGGSTFYNDDGLLPDKAGRTWKECDINYTGGYRGAERLVFSNDGLIYYTADHYQSFERLY